MKTVERPTFFGSVESPLFGVLHVPSDLEVRAGVVICGSLGKEGMDSARMQRVVGGELAARGFRRPPFDYLGAGDSAYSQLRSDSVANWCASVGYAVDYLRDIGAASIAAVGLRAGSLILDDAVRSGAAVDRVAHVDPVASGARYLREQAALFQFVVGDDAMPAGTVSIIGARLNGAAAGEFRALALDDDPRLRRDTLLIVRPQPERCIRALADRDGVHAVTAPGLPEFAQPADLVVPMPSLAMDSLIEWVELSRRIAAQGSEALRWDRSGIGQSGEPSRELWRWIYTKADIADSIAAAHHATDDPTALHTVGVCSGSWYAAHAARGFGGGAVTMVGVVTWIWRPSLAWPRQWHIRRAFLARAPGASATRRRWEHRQGALIAKSRGMRVRFTRAMRRSTPRFVSMALGRLGLAQSAEAVIGQLARRGTDVTVVLTPEDAARFRSSGGEHVLDGLRYDAPALVAVPTGDHTAYHEAVLDAIRHVVLDRSIARHVDHPLPTPGAGLP